MMFATPREAALQAELDRAKAELEYLRHAVDRRYQFTPLNVIDEIDLPNIPETLQLPLMAGVEGNLRRDGRYSVIVRTRFPVAEQLQVAYYADGARLKMTSDYLANQVLPMLHERFIYALMEALKK